MTSQITVRQIVEEDLGRVSEIHMSAFSDSALTKMGHDAIRRSYEWQFTGPHPHVVAIGCEYNGTLSGFCFGGRFQGAMIGFLRHNWPFLIWRVLSHPWLLLDKTVRAQGRFGLEYLLTKRLPQKRTLGSTNKHADKKVFSSDVLSFGILSIAVHPQFQGLGLGKAIIQEAERIATQDGFHRMLLTVNLENSHTIRFYESQGWQRVPNNEDWAGMMVKLLPLEYIMDNERF